MSGTYGVALPVFADDRLLSPGDTADSLWISQSADGTSGYRTNVAVVFPDPAGGEATVTLYDADGNGIGSKDYALGAAGFQQFGVGSFAGPVSIARAEVQVIRGRAASYSVVVDNITGDSSLFTFEELPAGWQDVLVNGVARANGRNNTFFRTDGRFYNPGSTDATVSVAFHASQNSNPSPLTGTFTVPAGKIRDVVDVLDSLLALPVGSAGALLFKSDASVAILCRTSNVDPAGVNPGTFGAQQKPRQLLSFLMSADAGAVVTGIRQNAAFRTNIGFAAGGDGAAYTLTLKSASGATVATATGSLGNFGWTQPNVQDLFPGTTVPDDATLLVKVTSGSVDVFDSSIDNASGDPVVTPIMPVPADIPSSATIGPLGGSIRSSDGIFTLKVPAGALATPTPISIAITTNDAPGALGPGYEVSPGDLEFAQPALLCLRYGGGVLSVRGIDGTSVAVLTGAGWAGLTGGRVETSSRALLIRLWNTSPSASLVAARTPQAVTSGSRFGPLAAFEIRSQDPLLPFGQGARANWLPTEGSTGLSAFFRLMPSSAGEEGRIVRLLGVQQVTVTWLRPRLGTVENSSGQATSYNAPHTISQAFVVDTIRVRFHDSATREARETKYYMNIIRRRWSLLVDFRFNQTCANGAVFSLAYTRTRKHDFVFDNDMNLGSLFAQGDSSNVDTLAGVCAPCTLGSQGTVGDLEFIQPKARFVELAPTYFFLQGSIVVRRGFRAIEGTCPNSPAAPYPWGFPASDLTYALPFPDVGFWPLSNESLFSGDKIPTETYYLAAIWSSS
ncbi:MAG: hypothetical protein ABI768_10135 [Acidobacteriota bacterium]